MLILLSPRHHFLGEAFMLRGKETDILDMSVQKCNPA